MSPMQDVEAGIRAIAESILRSVPARLQLPARLALTDEGFQPASAAPPCVGKNCPTTIIGHNPLIVILVSIGIGILIGLAIGVRLNRTR